MRGVTLSVALLLLQTAAAGAQDVEGCQKFAWPIARERGWFAMSGNVEASAGDTLAAVPQRALLVHLKPNGEAQFAKPPERMPRIEHWFGGALSLSAPPKPGLYQITLSLDAWVDVIQNDRFVRSAGSTGRGDCPGLRKSIRLVLAAEPMILQFSGVTANSLFLAIVPAE